MKKLLALIVLALAVPSLALAAKPPTPGSNGKGTPKVLYILKGTLTAYTAASGTTDGTVSIKVSSSNLGKATLKGQTLTFAVSSTATKASGTVTVGDKGVVKVRAAKKVTAANLLATLQPAQQLNASQVVDQGATG